MMKRFIMMMCVFVFCALGMSGFAQAQTKAHKIRNLSYQGFKYSQLKQWEKCVTTFKQLATIYPAATVYSNLAVCFEKQGKYTLAKKYYERALSTSTRPFDPKTKKGQAYIESTQKAIKAINKKIERQDRLKATVGAAKKDQVNGNYNSAIKNYLEAHAYENNALYLLEAARSAQRLSETAKTNKSEELRRALRLVDRALLETVIPLNNKNLYAARALKKQLNAQMQDALQAQEEANWTTQRVDWKTYTGATTGVIGGALLGVALGVFGPRVREGYDNMNVNDREVYDQQAKDINRTKAQGQFLFWTGVALTAVGSGLVVWDLMTVERVRKPNTDAKVVFNGNQAAFLVRF